MIIESIPTTLAQQFQLVLVFSSLTLVLRMPGLLKSSIDPGTYTVAGEGADKAQLLLQMQQLFQIADSNTPAVLVAIAGLYITISFVVKGIKGGIILSILTTTVLAIAVGLDANLSGIDFASNNLSSAAVNDLGTLFALLLVQKV